MAKKVKCIECKYAMNWAMPRKVTEENIDYAKHCLNVGKRTVSCEYTMKTKAKTHEQYCKHFISKEECDKANDEWHEKEIERLERMIAEYEAQEEGEPND